MKFDRASITWISFPMLFSLMSCRSSKEQSFDRSLWLSANVWELGNPRLFMEDAVLVECHRGLTKSQVINLIGEPTVRERKDVAVQRDPRWPPCYWPDFDKELHGSGTILGSNNRRAPDPNDVEIWSYYLGEFDVGECESIQIRFNRKGIVTKAIR